MPTTNESPFSQPLVVDSGLLALTYTEGDERTERRTWVNSSLGFKTIWLYMFEPPWRHSRPKYQQKAHWFVWVVGWAWALAGLILGAAVAPVALRLIGLVDSPNEFWLSIGMAVLVGFFGQVLGWILIGLTVLLADVIAFPRPPDRATAEDYHLMAEASTWERGWVLLVGVSVVAIPLPFVVVLYALYRYVTWIGPGQSSVTIAFVGGLLVKTFLIPLIKGIVTGTLFKWFMKWLRGGKKQEG